MSELRTRMIRDMALRGFSPRTHEAYIAAVVKLAKYYKRSPDQLSNEEVQGYLAHLIQERKLAWSTCSQAAHAFRFLYHVTLGHPRTDFRVPAPRQPQRLPELLSRQDVWRLLNACLHPRHRLLLATTYAGGLRVSEVVALKVSDLDADRMTVRVAQGNRTRKAKLARCRELLAQPPAPADRPLESVHALMLRLTGLDIARCAVCHRGRLHVIEIFPPPPRPARPPSIWNTS